MPQRYFLPELNHKITDQDAHHIKKVMRMRDGDEIIVCIQGTCYLASIQIEDNDINYTLIKKLEQQKTSNITLTNF